MTTSYDNDDEAMVITCDTCPAEDTAEGSFRVCIATFKEKGWRTFKEAGEWKNSCAECFEKWKKVQFAQKVDNDKKSELEMMQGVVDANSSNPADLPF